MNVTAARGTALGSSDRGAAVVNLRGSWAAGASATMQLTGLLTVYSAPGPQPASSPTARTTRTVRSSRYASALN